jgi:hypothetical protein
MGQDEAPADVPTLRFTTLVAVKISALARRLELRTKTTIREKTLHIRCSRISTNLEIDMAEGLGLRLSGPCCPTTDVGGAVVTSSVTPNVGAGGETMVGAATGPRTTS